MITQDKQECSVCGEDYVGFGNNAYPVNEGRCCDSCNMLVVIPVRLNPALLMIRTAGKKKKPTKKKS